MPCPQPGKRGHRGDSAETAISRRREGGGLHEGVGVEIAFQLRYYFDVSCLIYPRGEEGEPSL